MSKILPAALMAMLLVLAVGCDDDRGTQADQGTTPTRPSGSDTPAVIPAVDVCTHCEGVQKATADGKCERCQMDLKTMAAPKGGKGDKGGQDAGADDKADAKNTGGDACPHCEGVQTATADGKCPVCKMAAVVVKPAASAGADIQDACAHCTGVQEATADGKCPVCGLPARAK